MPQIRITVDCWNSFIRSEYVSDRGHMECCDITIQYPHTARTFTTARNCNVIGNFIYEGRDIISFVVCTLGTRYYYYYHNIIHGVLDDEGRRCITIELGDIAVSHGGDVQEQVPDGDDIEYNPEVSKKEIETIINICKDNVQCHK